MGDEQVEHKIAWMNSNGFIPNDKSQCQRLSHMLNDFIYRYFGKGKTTLMKKGYWLPELAWEEALTAKRDFFGWNYSVFWLCWLLHKSMDVSKLRNVQQKRCILLYVNFKSQYSNRIVYSSLK